MSYGMARSCTWLLLCPLAWAFIACAAHRCRAWTTTERGHPFPLDGITNWDSFAHLEIPLSAQEVAANPSARLLLLLMTFSRLAAGGHAVGNGYFMAFSFSCVKDTAFYGTIPLVSQHHALPNSKLTSRQRLLFRCMRCKTSAGVHNKPFFFPRQLGIDCAVSIEGPSRAVSPAMISTASEPSLRRTPMAKLPVLLLAAVVLALMRSLKGEAFWQFAIGFLSGGLFFSTVVAAAGAFYTFGADNCRRISRLFMLAVQRVWVLVVTMLRASIEVLFDPAGYDSDGDASTSRWSASAALLRKGFTRVRQAAAEGVQAIKLEAKLYAAAIGPPGLAVPQYLLGRLTATTLAGVMRDSLIQSLDNITNPEVRSLKLKDFNVGEPIPQLLAARLYDLGAEDMALDIDMRWRSTLLANIDVQTVLGLTIPVSVRNLHFEGPVRILVTKLSTKSPGYGALLLSLPSPPLLEFDLRVLGGEVTKLPWLGSELTREVQLTLAEQLVWPRRLVIPATLPPVKTTPPVLSPAQLSALLHDDPLLRAERALAEQPVLKEWPHAPASPNISDMVVKVMVGDDEEPQATKTAAVTLSPTDASTKLASNPSRVQLTSILNFLRNIGRSVNPS